MSISISPNFDDSKLEQPTIDDLVDVYEDRVRHWLLEPAASLLSHPHGGIACLCLLMTYFEAAWSYRTGQRSHGRSRAFFKEAFADVFKGKVAHELLLRLGGVLYDDSRCGFFHSGMFRERIYIAEMNHDIVVTLPKKDGVLDLSGEIQSVLLDPSRCMAAVQKHFEQFIASLRDSENSDLRNRFFQLFKAQCDWEKDGPVIGIPEPNS